MTALIEARQLDAGYGGTPVVRQLDLHVDPGEVVALFGPNGAGKTTTLMTLCGELPGLAGEVLIDGQPTTAPLHHRARRGLGLVTEQRAVFTQLTVADNLKVSRCDPARALALFPELEPHMNRRAGLLSGGQQQMLALVRAVSRGTPRLLLIDEISLGLAPQVVDRLLAAIKDAAASGMGVLLVEQYIHKALQVADRIYVMRRGRLQLTGPAEEFRNDTERIHGAYLSAEPGEKAALDFAMSSDQPSPAPTATTRDESSR
jgi:branched-chain amino acid transport system ATP-binding protein